MFKTKKQLIESNQDMLFYKTQISLIEQVLREAKETNENPYITIRKIRDKVYKF
jgi:hypothetical protein